MSRIRHQHYAPPTGAVDADLFTGSAAPPAMPAGDRPPLALRYAAWRATELGADLFHQVARAALNLAQGGARRIEINALWASIRALRHVSMDNSFRAPAARELRARYPELRDLIEVRGAV